MVLSLAGGVVLARVWGTPCKEAIYVVTAVVLINRFIAQHAARTLLTNHLGIYLVGSTLLHSFFSLATQLFGLSLVVGGFFAGLGLGEGMPAACSVLMTSRTHPSAL